MPTLPLTNNPEEKFSVTISGVVYNIRQIWNTLGYWALDIKDEAGAVIIYGIKLVTKTDLTQQYPGIPFNLRSEADNDPTRNDLDSFNLEITDKDV